MVDKKIGFLIVALVLSTICLSAVYASLEVTKEEVSSMAIVDLDKPAIFNLHLKNLGATDNFSLYSFAGVNIEPNESFIINSGETKDIVFKAMPTYSLRISPDYLSFEYEIRGQNSGIQKERMVITLVNLKDAFNIYVDNINPLSDRAIVHFENKAGHSFDNVNLRLTSEFFAQTLDFSMAAKESKNLSIAIDKDKAKELFAGPFIVNAQVKINGVTGSSSAVMMFEEKPGIEVSESFEGKIARRHEIEKTNVGNVNTEATIVVSKDLFSALFTSFNIVPTRTELHGFKKSYIFTSDLAPGKSLKVVVLTNWWILIGIIVLIIVIWYLLDRYIKNKIVLTKRIFPVRTKGGEFALKVTIKAKARDFVEKIRIYDRLPPMVKIFERTGISNPDKVDVDARRLEWDISALSKGEERIFDYIVYSKIGLVGKFELPPATAVYEFEGKIKEASSNRAVFENESKKKKEF